jgi:hypothetical protein
MIQEKCPTLEHVVVFDDAFVDKLGSSSSSSSIGTVKLHRFGELVSKPPADVVREDGGGGGGARGGAGPAPRGGQG